MLSSSKSSHTIDIDESVIVMSGSFRSCFLTEQEMVSTAVERANTAVVLTLIQLMSATAALASNSNLRSDPPKTMPPLVTAHCGRIPESP